MSGFINISSAMVNSIELYDIQGRLVSNYVLNSNELEQSFDATNFNDGVYIIRLTNTAKTRTVKIILN